MNRPDAKQYLSGSLLAASGTGLLLWVYGLLADVSLLWLLAGALPMALIGVVGGGLVARQFGRPGSAFIVAVGSCILIRLLTALFGMLAVKIWGSEGLLPYLVGMALMFAAMQLFEIVWFYRTGISPAFPSTSK